MKKTKLLSLTLTIALLSGIAPSGKALAAEPGSEQWKAEANLSLSEYGAESPYYSTGQQPQRIPHRPTLNDGYNYYSWFNYNDYSIYCDPYYGLRLLKNVGQTGQVEATPSTGVIPFVQSELAPGCMPDFSNRIRPYFPYETVGITPQEFAGIPMPAVCSSWRNPSDYAEEMLNYSLHYHNLIWAHKGDYSFYTWPAKEGITGRKMMEWPVIDATIGYPIGCHTQRYSPEDTYNWKCYNDAVKNIYVTYPYPNSTPFTSQRTMEIHYGSNQIKADDGIYYDDVWTIHFVLMPNEMDLQHVRGLLHLITPDAEAIYAAIKTDLYGPKEQGPWRYPNETYTLGYAPWKYYDKWYDIGTQSRICSSYIAQTEESAERGGQGTGFTGSGYVYKIAPRVGVNAPGYELRYDPYF